MNVNWLTGAEDTRAWLNVLTGGDGYPFILVTRASDESFPETYYQTVDALGYDPLQGDRPASKDPTR